MRVPPDLCYEGDKVSKLLGVFARLQVEDVQARFVVSPLQGKVVGVALRVSLDIALYCSESCYCVRSEATVHKQRLTCRANSPDPALAIADYSQSERTTERTTEEVRPPADTAPLATSQAAT